MKVVKENLISSLETIKESTRMKFDEVAEELLKKCDPLDLLAKTLVVAAGHEQRSLITSVAGLVTFKMTSEAVLTDAFEAQHLLPLVLLYEAVNVKICHDKKSFVFDVPMSAEQEFAESPECDENISVLEELPLLALEEE